MDIEGWRRRAYAGAMVGLAFTASVAVAAQSGQAASGDPVAGDELVVTDPAAPAPAAAGTPAADNAKGMVWTGLSPARNCGRGFAVANGDGLCTHGPDLADVGIDVRRPRSVEELVAAVDEGPAAMADASIPCYGDGTSGNRVQVVYAHAQDVPDRFAQLASSLAGWAGYVDSVFNRSAGETGGVRHVRWVTDANCSLIIQRVQLSATGDDSFSATINELKSVGLNRTDRKYLVWTDATLYCGISSLRNDDSAAATNANNTGGSYARVDSGCWGLGKSTEAHELMHMLGGVQDSAPHSTGAGHCTDEYDRMCYADTSGVAMTYSCPTTSEQLFDCNDDDYFSTNPPAGSYLATHWNAAMSTFLEQADPPPPSSTTTTAPPPTTTTPTTAPPGPEPSGTASDTWTGSLSRKAPTATYPLSSGSGDVQATLTFSRAKSLTVSIVRPDGSVVASRSGRSGVVLTATLEAGSYSVVVSGATNASFTLTVRYPGA